MLEDHRQCPIVLRNGKDCWQQSHPFSRSGLCSFHIAQAVEDWVTPRPMPTLRCRHCGILAMKLSLVDDLAYCVSCKRIDSADEMREIYELGEAIEAAAHPYKLNSGVVYYLRFGDRIKIGTSTNLRNRLEQLPHDECLAVEPGTARKEHARHRQFLHLRVPGQTEWFHTAPDLVQHINELRTQHGEPFAAVLRWKKQHDSRSAAA